MADIEEWLVIILAAVSGVAWLVRLEGRVNRNTEANQRTERRLDTYEATHQAQALQLVRIEEANKGIKLTVDRIYAQVSAGQRVLHHTDKTNGPWGDA